MSYHGRHLSVVFGGCAPALGCAGHSGGGGFGRAVAPFDCFGHSLETADAGALASPFTDDIALGCSRFGRGFGSRYFSSVVSVRFIRGGDIILWGRRRHSLGSRRAGRALVFFLLTSPADKKGCCSNSRSNQHSDDYDSEYLPLIFFPDSQQKPPSCYLLTSQSPPSLRYALIVIS